MKKIKLAHGKVALLDDEDYEKLNKYNWSLSRRHHMLYATSKMGTGKTSKMHRVILAVPLNIEIDHRDNNGLNNQKDNLRICTRSQNQANRNSLIGTSVYKGVSRAPRSRLWRTDIQARGKHIYLGQFKSEKDAALVYNVAAIKYFGEFARLNTINEVNREDLLRKLGELGL